MLLKSIYIENYKGFKHLVVPELGQVNLIWGTNNVGKSSLLEAISIYASEGSVEQIENVLNLRDEQFPKVMSPSTEENDDRLVDVLLHLVHNYSRDILEKGAFVIGESQDKDIIRFRLVKRYRGVKDNGQEIVTAAYNDAIDDTINDVYSAIEITNKEGKNYIRTNGRTSLPKNSSDDCKCIFVSSATKMFTGIGGLWSSISMTEMEGKIIEALRIIEPRIEKFNILLDESMRMTPFVFLEGDFDKRRLSTLGDGINRILRIVLALVNCKDGVLLVDEIENGLHYSVQTKLWKIINQLAQQLNVQVFATTHSIDCIHSFARCAKDYGCMAFRLDNYDGEIEVQTYADADNLLYAVSENIELR